MTDTITLPKEVLDNLTESLENLMAWQVKNCKVWDHPTWDNAHMRLEQVRAALAQQAAPKCNPHPKAPHGFNRNSSHSEDRYVCDCEGWDAWEAGYSEGMEAGLKIGDYMDASNELQDAMTKPQVAQLAEQVPPNEALGLILREMRYIASISTGQVHRVAMATLEKLAAAPKGGV